MPQSNKPITPAQLKKLQTMFSKLGFDKEAKADMIEYLTDGRTTSTKDITCYEAKLLIDFLSGKIYPEKSRKKQQQEKEEALKTVGAIYRLSFEIGMCYGSTHEDKLMNFAKISRFCRERGTVKKDITKMSLPELKKTKKQFEAILQHSLESSVKKLVNKSLNPITTKQY